MKRRGLFAVSVGAAILTSPMVAFATPVTFSGEDIMATTTSPNPNSAAAQASFDSAVAAQGASNLITFEGLPLGPFGSLSVGPDASISGSDYMFNAQTIRDTSNSPTIPTLDGYNTTPGGAYFVEVKGGTVTFTFSTPIQAFGAYFSGVQTGFFPDAVNFSDGTNESLLIPGAGTSNNTGALSYVGFTDFGQSISSVTINAGNLEAQDFIGIDDVRYQFTQSTPVPEPLTFSVFGAGLIGMTALRRKKKAGA